MPYFSVFLPEYGISEKGDRIITIRPETTDPVKSIRTTPIKNQLMKTILLGFVFSNLVNEIDLVLTRKTLARIIAIIPSKKNN